MPIGNKQEIGTAVAVGLDVLNNVVITSPFDGDVLKYDSIDSLWKNGAVTGGAGITLSINNIIGNTTAGATASTDYVYFCTGTLTLTLPTCILNTNRYTVKCLSGILTIATSLAQTIDGSATISVAVEDSVDIISNNIEWKIV